MAVFYPNGGVPGNSVEHSSRCSQVQAEQQEAIGGMYLETGHWKFDLDSSSASFIQVHPLEYSSEHSKFGILVLLAFKSFLSLTVTDGGRRRSCGSTNAWHPPDPIYII